MRTITEGTWIMKVRKLSERILAKRLMSFMILEIISPEDQRERVETGRLTMVSKQRLRRSLTSLNPAVCM